VCPANKRKGVQMAGENDHGHGHNEEKVMFLHVSLRIKPQHLSDFQEKMQLYLKSFYKKYRWELVNAAYHVTGTINNYVHVWRLPSGKDANAVYQVMTKERDDAQYKEIQKCIEFTTQELTAAAKYDPMMFGYQRETLILDCKNAGWMLNNKKLMKNTEPNTDEQNEIMRLAEEGALMARLTSGNSLLFNLAQIAPKSCFQWNELSFKESVDNENDSDQPIFPKNIKALHILTPWGTICFFDEGKLKKEAAYLSPEEIKAALKETSIISSKVPLASIPEPKNSIPGEGCMCYVINLASFE
jgi:hypothetical protein